MTDSNTIITAPGGALRCDPCLDEFSAHLGCEGLSDLVIRVEGLGMPTPKTRRSLRAHIRAESWCRTEDSYRDGDHHEWCEHHQPPTGNAPDGIEWQVADGNGAWVSITADTEGEAVMLAHESGLLDSAGGLTARRWAEITGERNGTDHEDEDDDADPDPDADPSGSGECSCGSTVRSEIDYLNGGATFERLVCDRTGQTVGRYDGPRRVIDPDGCEDEVEAEFVGSVRRVAERSAAEAAQTLGRAPVGELSRPLTAEDWG